MKSNYLKIMQIRIFFQIMNILLSKKFEVNYISNQS